MSRWVLNISKDRASTTSQYSLSGFDHPESNIFLLCNCTKASEFSVSPPQLPALVYRTSRATWFGWFLRVGSSLPMTLSCALIYLATLLHKVSPAVAPCTLCSTTIYLSSLLSSSHYQTAQHLGRNDFCPIFHSYPRQLETGSHTQNHM